MLDEKDLEIYIGDLPGWIPGVVTVFPNELPPGVKVSVTCAPPPFLGTINELSLTPVMGGPARPDALRYDGGFTASPGTH